MPQSDMFACAARHASIIKADLTWLTLQQKMAIWAAVESYQDSKRTKGKKRSLPLRKEIQLTITEAQETAFPLRQLVEAAALQIGICTGDLTIEQKMTLLAVAEKQQKHNHKHQETSVSLIISSLEEIRDAHVPERIVS